MNPLSSYATALIRTLAGYLVAGAASVPFAPAIEHELGVSDAAARAWLAGGLVFVLGSAYYAIVRKIEQRWPSAGVLLGVPARPVYLPAPPGKHAEHLAANVAAAAGVDLVNDEP